MIGVGRRLARRLHGDVSGLALIEFALTLPIFVLMCIGGTELANYITVRMRLSQIALQAADDAARMGAGSPLAAKTVREMDINDVMAGAQIASGRLDIQTNGRIILSNVEPVANPNTNDLYKISWQRCYGAKTAHASTWWVAGDTNKPYMGPSDKRSKALPDSATMFVEVYYVYKPMIATQWVPQTNIVEIASMAVRDRRNLTTPDNSAAVPRATC